MTYQEALEHARELDKSLKATDFHYDRMVEIRHDDGTIMFKRYTEAQILNKEWTAVFSEHDEPAVYSNDDCPITVWIMEEEV